ncbi:MAG: hypothetical protein DWI24_09575 [Planctomycetota bacterium]|nr:MAG: hypothetical protein DWI24_09575 [Planctomycetota bacterium]
MNVWTRSLGFVALVATHFLGVNISAQDKPAEKAVIDSPLPMGLILDDLPTIFVPAHPATVSDKRQLEMAELFVAARAHESRRQWNEALELLSQCSKLDPENLAVLKRMSRLNFAIGKQDQGVEISRKILAIEPDDPTTLRLMVGYYERRGQFPQAEKLLTETLANPKLDAKSQAALYAHFARGLLYAGRLQQPLKAADELAKVMEMIDEKTAANENPTETNRILGNNPAQMYLNFGRVFVATQKWDFASKAFERGLSYNPDDNLMSVLHVTSLLEAGKPDKALTQLDIAIRRKPVTREPYDLLNKVLTALKRTGEATTRLEALNKSNPDNPGLIAVLADLYRDSGDSAKAKVLYDQLVKIQPDPQGLGALAASLIKDKKYDGFLDLMSRAMARPGGLDSLRPQIEALATNAEESSIVLDTAIKRLQANPTSLQRATYNSLFYLARKSEHWQRLVTLRTLAVKADPNAETMRELAMTYYENAQFQEAASAMIALFKQFPTEKDRRNLVMLAQFQLQAKQPKDSLATVEGILKSDPNDPSAIRMKCYILNDLKQFDEAIRIGKEILKKAPEDSDFNRLLGATLMRADKNQEAISFYKNLLQQFPANVELARVAHSGLSVIYVNLDEFAKGEQELEQLLKRSPDDIGVNNDLGYLYADQGKRLEEAESMIRKAVAEEPDNSAYLDSLGWVLYKRGKAEEALKYLEKAIVIARRSSPDGTLFDHIGDVLFRLKKFDRAKEAWIEAQKHLESGKAGEKLAKSLKTKLENVESMPKQVKTDKAPNP